MKIIKFEKDGCALCKRMDATLQKLGVSYEKINLDHVENADEFISKYSLSSAPTLVKFHGESFETLGGVHSTSEISEFCEVGSQGADEEEHACCANGVCSFS